MSGRGKGGKGLGSGLWSSKKAKVAAPDPYTWTEGEEAALVSMWCTDDHSYPNAYVVAWGQLHPYIATALTTARQQPHASATAGTGKRLARININLDQSDDNDDFFRYIKASDVSDHRGIDGEGGGGDSDEEVEDRQEVVGELEEWLTSKIDFWGDEPNVAIKIRGTVCCTY